MHRRCIELKNAALELHWQDARTQTQTLAPAPPTPSPFSTISASSTLPTNPPALPPSHQPTYQPTNRQTGVPAHQASHSATYPGTCLPTPLRAPLLRLVRQLYDRDMRRSFMGGAASWLADASRLQTISSVAQRIEPHLLDASAENGGGASEGAHLGGQGTDLPEYRRVAAVLLHVPFLVPFEVRLMLLRRWLNDRKREAPPMMQPSCHPTRDPSLAPPSLAFFSLDFRSSSAPLSSHHHYSCISPSLLPKAQPARPQDMEKAWPRT
eukprot:616191-Pleurochrysis_carterae.AAC.1